MPFKKFRPKFSIYQVCVTILEAKHLPQNANPLVVVKVGNRKKRTVVRERTDNPIYKEVKLSSLSKLICVKRSTCNYYFVFNFTCNLDNLLNTEITIAVYLRNFLRRLKFHGSTSFEVATVWEQAETRSIFFNKHFQDVRCTYVYINVSLLHIDRQYYHKWAVLTDPKDLTAGPKGYVKCNITVNVKDEKVKAHPDTMDEDDIEGNLLLPIGGERLPFRQRARYVFVVYRADGLPDMSSLCRKTDFENVNPYVQISFAGMKGSTSEAWQTYSPKFYEAIIFKEMFPVLCHRVRITIKHRIDSCRTCTVAVHILDTTKISNSREYGFLPTYGPSFIHFYGSDSVEKNGCSGKCLTAMPLYRGRVLLSLKTEMDDPEASPGIRVETVPAFPIIEFLTENELLEKRVKFESQSAPRTTGSLDGKYNYVPLGSRKPCLYVRSWWPNLKWRMYNSNNLRHICDFLETRLEKLEVLMARENPVAFVAYNETMHALKVHCTRYLHVLDTGKYEIEGGTTKLDRHRASLCRRSVEDILKRMKITGELPNNNYMRIAMVHAYQYLRKLRNLCDDPQHSLPDIFVWMIAGSKRVAYSRLPAEQILYSEEAVEMGGKCGRRINLFPRNQNDEREPVEYSACKIEAFLWLGSAKYAAACWSAIPPGYEIDHGRNVDTFPKYIEYNQSSTFQLRAHIFQGRFDPGMDVSGLLDSFVRVAFRGYTASTQVIRQSLDPFWDQTLIFPPIILHGTKEHIKFLPPEVILQAFHQDLCGTREFCGRCIAVPLVKLATETYSPPDFPPKLEWYKFQSQKDCTGSVLAAFELMEVENKEISDVPMNMIVEDKIYSIPPDIRPKMTSYRLEVIFWGVRDMRKIKYMPVRRPRIIVECAGVHVKSEVMKNARRFSNFEEPHIMIELYLCRSIIVPRRKRAKVSLHIRGWLQRTSTLRNQIYSTELEMQPQFEEFQDRLRSFELWRGRRGESPEHGSPGDNYAGKFKVNLGHISIYRWPHPDNLPCKTRSGRDAANGLCNDYPPQEPVKLLVRLYVVKEIPFHFIRGIFWCTLYSSVNWKTRLRQRADSKFAFRAGINLQPKDPLSGKSDPYLCVKLGKNSISDRKNYIPNQLNPTFGRMFEIEANFPQDYMLEIQVWDYDATTADDLIGVTRIDIENRFYSRHRAHCGLANAYSTVGYNAWRDREKPTQILELLCRRNNLPPPEYGEREIKIGKQSFPFHAVIEREGEVEKLVLNNQCLSTDIEECMALSVLHHWQDFPTCGCALVPEHVERRPLFNVKRPGLEQGKLEMWVDLFRIGQLPPKSAVNITPPTPEEYEIRVIVWNTENVPLTESQFLTGEKCSDIYVKGWIQYEDHQKTDIHYNSLTGEGNFNWRFVFRVTYSKGENVMIVRRRMSVFAKNEIEEELPCKLRLQVWDSDHFSSDDFLGELTLDLSRMPRGSLNSKTCTLKLLEPQLPTINLFKVTRTRAWWPFTRSIGAGRYIQAVKCIIKPQQILTYYYDGNVELEISVLKAIDADNRPAGKGRDPPQNLPPPRRPDTSFSWFRNPWRACCFVVCRYYKWRILCCFMCTLFVLLVACGIYAFPGYFVKRLLGA
ncbi:otoferlin [Solenopsis invicta]|uniref:otoferlin n=1 Tax=Solenopsis invicta TaxID=13686 RepID=UPI00193DAD68|nr:otoferlin [Solenopsis invicta]